MRFLKKLLLGLGSLFLILIASVFIIQSIAEHATAYLNLEPELQGKESYLIRNIHILPMNQDTLLKNKSVWIKEGMIHQIADVISEDLPVIDGSGKYLSPGLVDMHAHVMDKQELGLYLANGVTSIRNLMGMPFHLALRDKINTGELLGPIIYTSSSPLTSKDDNDLEKIQIQSPDHGREVVKRLKAEGYDFIKTYNRLDSATFEAILDAAGKENMPIAAHPSFEVDYSFHFQKGISTIEHTEDIVQQPLDFKLDTNLLHPVIQAYVNSGQTHTPTLVVYHSIVRMLNEGDAFTEEGNSLYHNPFIRSISEDDYTFWTAYKERDSTIVQRINTQHSFHLEILKRLHKAGVNIVAGTDAGVLYTPAGFSIHEELGFYTQAGMTPYEALRTATYNPTQVYPAFQTFGTIEAGKMANLIVSTKNPLENLTTLKEPEYVIIKGHMLDKDRIETLKEKAYKRNNYLSTLLRYGAFIMWHK